MLEFNFLVYKSSAGSGKTFTLVKEYLKLALRDKNNLSNSFKGILAITFTNKAAAEMKWRIIRALREISTHKNEFLSSLIAKELQINSEDLYERASIVLTSILHHYSDFSIGTIDSFTHRIIRTFALDLQLPFNFQIETDTDSVFNKVISSLISNLGKDELITNYLVQFSLSQVEENKSWDPEKLLFDFIKEINKEGDVDVSEQFKEFQINDFEITKNKLYEFIKSYELFLKNQGGKGIEIIQNKKINKDAFSGGGTMFNFFKFLKNNERTTSEELFISTVNKTLETQVWHSTKATLNDKDLIYSVNSQLEAIAYEVKKYLTEHEKKYTVYNLIYKNIYAMGLVNELAKLTAEYKEDENVLFLSEFNERISKVVSDEPTPFIFERLGDRYKHFLLDEFQDTSAMQWHNLLPLVDNSLANGNLNLVVGDGKQSIYRWRNANVEQFINLPLIKNKDENILLSEREASLIRNFKEEFLDTNFRSEPTIVQFNNHLFEFLSHKLLDEDFKRIYFNQEQKHKIGESGYVSIQFPELNNDDVDVINTKLTLTHIEQAINDGYQYNDICIIVSKNYNGNTIANFLIEHNIPVVSRESLLLNNAKEIIVLTSFLKYILNQHDFISASVVINYLYLYQWFSEEKYIEFLKLVNLNKSTSLIKLFNQAGIKIDELKIATSNLYDCCVEISKALKLNETNPQYIRFFLDEVLSFLQTNTSNISTFLNWWEKRSAKASVIIPEGINAVNIMTIHASKGLEFPIVISPYVNFKTDKANPIWVNLSEAEKEELNLPIALLNIGKKIDSTEYSPVAQKELMLVKLDCLNMLYVNFTRAVERLHIISPKPNKTVDNTSYSWLKEYALNQASFDKELNTLEVGTLEPKKQHTHIQSKLEQFKIETLKFNAENPIKIKNASGYKSNEEVTKAREYGILVHNILSQINSINDIETIIEKSVLKGEINEFEALSINNDLNEILQNAEIESYFKNELNVKNEFEILNKEGEILRPDRVVIIGNEAIIIDYKTGKKNSSKYHSQMQDYKNALLELGYTSVKKVLLYIHEKEIEILA